MSLADEDKGAFTPVKLILMGESGAGKTGALAPLVRAGFHLHILDLDNGLPILRNLLTDGRVRSEWTEEDLTLLNRVHNYPLSEQYETKEHLVTVYGAAGKQMVKKMIPVPKAPIAWDRTMAAMGSIPAVKNPHPRDILVVDSLTALDKALQNAQALTVGRYGSQKEQQDYGTILEWMTQFIGMLTSESLNLHVIFICHTSSVQDKGDFYPVNVPRATGTKLPKVIPALFNQWVEVVRTKSKAVIRIKPRDDYTKLKSPYAAQLPDELPQEDGLLTYFRVAGAVDALNSTGEGKGEHGVNPVTSPSN